MFTKEEIISRLTSSLGRRDEEPNIQLAKAILDKKDNQAVQLLIDLLQAKKDLQNDSIKVLYTIGELKPDYILPYLESFIAALESKNNRLQWGAMTALACIAQIEKEKLISKMPQLKKIAQNGSVICLDQFTKLLITIAQNKSYYNKLIPSYFEVLEMSPPNQFPQYVELAYPIIRAEDQEAFSKIIQFRIEEMKSPAKQKRLEKILKKTKGLIKILLNTGYQ